MTAQEARKLTNSKLKDLQFVKESIETMAKAAKLYACHELATLLNPQEIKTALEADGFEVKITDLHLSINW